jgi:serine/threonine protein kinase
VNLAWEEALVTDGSMPPVLFGKYRLLKKIAQGGMAEIFLAKSTGAGGFEKTVIVKRILPRLAAHDKFVRMFINEAKVTSALSHSNIVQIFDFGRIGTDYFIAMEYVDGKDLRSIIRACRDRSRKVPLEFVLYTGVQVTKGLDYAHTRMDSDGTPLKLIHRDVSPQNVLLSRQGELKITDFGIAKATGTLTETVANEIKGNFGYMPPEQAAGAPLDPRCDVYAAAMVLYELATLKNPFADTNLLTVIQRIREMPVPPPSTYNPAVSKSVDQLLVKALSKKPEDRFGTAGELCAALSEELFPSPTELVQASYSAFLNSLFPPELTPRGAAPAPFPESDSKPSHPTQDTLPPEEDGDSVDVDIGPIVRGTPPSKKDFEPKRPSSGVVARKNVPAFEPDSDVDGPIPGGPAPKNGSDRFTRKVRDLGNLGRLRLDIAPSNVEVYIDDQMVVVGAPVEIQTSAKVEHVLELRCDGFSDFATTFTLEAGEIRDFQIVLAERSYNRTN